MDTETLQEGITVKEVILGGVQRGHFWLGLARRQEERYHSMLHFSVVLGKGLHVLGSKWLRFLVPDLHFNLIAGCHSILGDHMLGWVAENNLLCIIHLLTPGFFKLLFKLEITYSFQINL